MVSEGWLGEVVRVVRVQRMKSASSGKIDGREKDIFVRGYHAVCVR